MKWFDSDYDYIDEFTTQWNERYKKIKRIGIILSVVLILIGILCFAFPEKVFTTIQIIAAIGLIGVLVRSIRISQQLSSLEMRCGWLVES